VSSTVEEDGESTSDLFTQVAGWEDSDDDIFREPADGSRDVSVMRVMLEWGAVVAGALLAALLLQATLLKAFYIPSESMLPTLEVQDRVMVNKVAYKFGDPQHGDVIVFHRPESAAPGQYEEYIKRVIGLPGDLLESRNGQVFRNGVALDETYLAEGTVTNNLGPLVVEEGMLFVMGDNRMNSQDSRFFGAIDDQLVVGRAIVRVWPPDRVGGL
jgi:signal peptidase I